MKTKRKTSRRKTRAPRREYTRHKRGLKTPGDELLITEYLRDFNRAEAMYRAGFKGTRKSASVLMCRFLARPEIREEIRKRLTAIQERSEIDKVRLLDELWKVATFNLDDLLVLDEHGDPRLCLERLTRDQLAAISQIDLDGKRIRVKTHDKLEAARKIGEHLRLWRADDASPLAPVTVNVFGSARKGAQPPPEERT